MHFRNNSSYWAGVIENDAPTTVPWFFQDDLLPNGVSGVVISLGLMTMAILPVLVLVGGEYSASLHAGSPDH